MANERKNKTEENTSIFENLKICPKNDNLEEILTEKKMKANGFIEDLTTNDKPKKNDQEIFNERTPNFKNNTKEFVEDGISKTIETTELKNLPPILKKKKADYIYDFVKIRVQLDNHFYILSRFFICRMLTLCKVEKDSFFYNHSI